MVETSKDCVRLNIFDTSASVKPVARATTSMTPFTAISFMAKSFFKPSNTSGIWKFPSFGAKTTSS